MQTQPLKGIKMPAYIEKAESMTLPVIILHDTVAFPSVTLNFELSESENIAAVGAANSGNGCVFIVTAMKEKPGEDDFALCPIGTAARLRQTITENGGNLRVIAEGFSRAIIQNNERTGAYFTAEVICKTYTLPDNGGLRGEAYVREAKLAFEHMMTYFPTVSADVVSATKRIDDPGLLADFIASNVLVRLEDKQKILDTFEPLRRIENLIYLLGKESELLECELTIHKKVRDRLNESQKERYLHEQLNAIRDELGEGDEEDEYYKKIISARLPKEVEEKLLRENERMARSQFGSAEASVIRNYLDICLELPWTRRTADRTDIAAARKILDEDHDGLEKVKERILEYLAVRQLNPDLKNQIICLVGPPGTGKTSVARSIARAMKRKYVRVSLGGVRDEADIRGHRKTYVGSMPGRIIAALGQVQTKNPLMLLDEIDKVGSDGRGDPASALLEVLDPEQNKYFRDHFIEVPFDLSDCLFVCTANSLETVPRPLIDRMEIIELKSYTRNEKLGIARHHLLPKQVKRHGMNLRMLKVTDEALIEVIDYYTAESGVRNLEREIAALCRKAAMRIVEEGVKRVTIDKSDIERYLGVRKIIPERLSPTDEVGVVNGLAYTEVGGDLLKIEAAVLEGSGKLELTGSLGDVMKESAQAAVSYIRSVARELGIAADFYKTKDIHIHVPEGAVPKDGPSAGVTIMTALVSALTGRAVKRDIAMTGEITLRGNVLAIGGLREKTMAAYKAGIKKVIIPADNAPNLEDVDTEAAKALTFITVRHASEVLENALLPAMPDVSDRGLTRPAVADIPAVLSDGKENTARDSAGA